MKKYLFVIFFMLTAMVCFAKDIPSYSGFVNDCTTTLDKASIQLLNKKLADYRDSTGIEIAVLIEDSLGDANLEDYCHDVYKKWGIGKNDKGVLLAIFLKDHLLKIEVGYGLEADITDLECGRIVNKENGPIAASFRENKYAEGIDAGLDAIIIAINAEYNPPAKPTRVQQAWSWFKALPWYLELVVIILFFILVVICYKLGILDVLVYVFLSSSSDSSSGGSGGGGYHFGGGSSGGGGASGGW